MMSPIKCPACGQRILNPAGMIRCPNCGASLMPQITMSPYSPDARDPSDDLSSQPALRSSSPDSDLNDADTTPLSSAAPSQVMSSFPKNFPQRPPDREGTITLLEAHEEPKRSNGAGEAVFSTVTDLLWAIPGGVGASTSSSQFSKEKEKAPVTRIRVRDANGEQGDIRIEGRLTGVNVAQGDRVSFWGKDRDGLLAFQYGYNHTTKGPIKTHKATSPISGFLFILVALVGIVGMFFYFYQGHWHF